LIVNTNIIKEIITNEFVNEAIVKIKNRSTGFLEEEIDEL